MTPRERRLLAIFNLTQEMWDTMFKYQDGRCGICFKLFGEDEIILTDHDHKTGQVRGLLCFRCNALLDEGVSIETYTRVIAYLRYLPATAALGAPHYGLPGRVGTSMARKRALARKRDKELAQAAAALKNVMPVTARLVQDVLKTQEYRCRGCAHLPHSRQDGRPCGSLDAAGDTCDCPEYIPDRLNPVR